LPLLLIVKAGKTTSLCGERIGGIKKGLKIILYNTHIRFL
jgi:hypothetical protein